MKKFFQIFSLLIGFTAALFSQNNFRIFPSSVTQTEPIVTSRKSVSPIFFVSAVTINTSSFFKSEGVYVSTDYGLNWFGSDTCKGQLMINHGGDPGVVITANNRLLLSHIGSVFPGVYCHYSDDLGTTWSSAYTITNQQTDDKGVLIIDDNPGSPYFGRIYSFIVIMVQPYPIYMSYSDNNGESWTTPVIINNQPPARCTGPSVVIDENGKIFVSWAAVASQAPFIEDYIGFAYSSNGGQTWSVQNNIIDINGIAGTLPEKGSIRVNGLPRMVLDKSSSTRNGWVYIFTTEKNHSPAGSDPDIIMYRSTDAGISWSNGIRVNQDQINNGKIQYFPAADIDSLGNLYVIYYDDRNTTSDSAEVFISFSSDGGNSWNDEVLSDHRFKPKPVAGGFSNYQGDYISLMVFEKKLYAFWMDDFSGIYQIWLKIKNIETNSIRNNENLNVDFRLEQNYPNPFNPITTIKYSLTFASEVKIDIYNMLGEKITELLNNVQHAGYYEVKWDAGNFASGIYLYKISAKSIEGKYDFNLIKKMILIR